ncbi:P27 family phage terminase small subunit [Tsukamurella tyrosinosolvens]|uniref:P27 family phage terminase small subunit n=1 Tax=Tsukamurella tyrosinosolvens TaxID=57704 RepID=UPI003F49D813
MVTTRGKASAGDELVARLMKSLPDGVELTETEAEIMNLIHDSADRLADLEKDIAKYGTTYRTDRGAIRVNPACNEARQTRTAMGRLISSLHLDAEAPSLAHQKASTAAKKGWEQRRNRAQRGA